MQQDGAGFAGFATWLDMTPADPDLFAMPDPDSLIQLPWKPEVAWLAGDLLDGRQAGGAGAAQRAEAPDRRRGRARTCRMKTGVECEFFLIYADGSAISDRRDTQEKPCYDQQALMRRYDVIAEICDACSRSAGSPTRTTTRTPTASSR